jgi:hypothetical protein
MAKFMCFHFNQTFSWERGLEGMKDIISGQWEGVPIQEVQTESTLDVRSFYERAGGMMVVMNLAANGSYIKDIWRLRQSLSP